MMLGKNTKNMNMSYLNTSNMMDQTLMFQHDGNNSMMDKSILD